MAQQKFSVAIRSDAYKNLINQTLGNPEIARNFVANITTAVSNNPALQKCDAGSIISAGLMAESLKLSLSNSLGYCYLIPYGDKAQFQMSWRGYVQLAQRSGQYKKIGVRAVHEGEYLGQDKFGEDTFKFSHEFDDKEVVGYFAYFELLNGFEKTLYWTKEQCEKHGKRYSKSFSKLWTTDFGTMAQKTVLKQLISKFGPLSMTLAGNNLATAIQRDQTAATSDGSYEYVDNTSYTDEEVKTNINIPDIPEDAKESL